MRIASLPVLVVLLFSAAASAQTVTLPSGSSRVVIAPETRDTAVRAQISIQIVLPNAAEDGSAEADKAREDARKAMYELAARECALLLAALASDCRLETINVNVSRQAGPRNEGIAVRGSMNYRITPK